MNWMTVKELARYLKLSEVMVYKLAQKGEIPASKIGSAWRFSENEIDDWLGSKSRKESWLSGPVKIVVEDFVSDLKKAFDKNFSAVIIFGSYARGEANAGSDLDILVVLKSITDYWATKKKIEDIAYSNTFDKNRQIIIAHILMEESEFTSGASPLLINIRREGKKAA